jgi:hypothetical protein
VRSVRGLLILLFLTAAPGVGRTAGALPTPVEAETAGPDSARVVPTKADSTRVVPTKGDSTRGVTIRADSTRAVTIRADSTREVRQSPARPWYRRPRWIMLRSAVVPGWGQWANGKHVKAVVVAAGEGYLLWRAVDYGRQEQAKSREALGETNPAQRARLERRHRTLASHRRDFTWWSVFAGLLSVGDAYVDAQLGNFDAEFKPQDTAGRVDDGPGWRAAVTLRW